MKPQDPWWPMPHDYYPRRRHHVILRCVLCQSAFLGGQLHEVLRDGTEAHPACVTDPRHADAVRTRHTEGR